MYDKNTGNLCFGSVQQYGKRVYLYARTCIQAYVYDTKLQPIIHFIP